MFLLSPVGLWVLQGLCVLPCPCVKGSSSQGVLVLCLRFVSVRLPSFPAPLAPALRGPLPRVSWFCAFGLSRFWLPSFPAPQVSYGLVVVSPGWSPHLWLYSFSCPTFVHCGIVICCLSPVWLPHIGRGSVVSSVFVSYAVCLRRLCS